MTGAALQMGSACANGGVAYTSASGINNVCTGLTGTPGATGPTGGTGTAGSFPACITGLTGVNQGRLCIDNTRGAATDFYSAMTVCWAKGKNANPPVPGVVSHVCHYTDGTDACAAYKNKAIGFDFYAGAAGNIGW